MPLFKTSKRQDQSETSVRLERYGDIEDGLSQTITRQLERARERDRDQREIARDNQRELEGV